MNGKTVLITGATAGIGRITARELADMGAEIVIVARNREKAEATKNWIKQETGNQAVSYILADLSAQREVRAAAEHFLNGHARLDVLVNNAGALFLSKSLSADGIEMTFALNHLAPFLLTNLLIDVLKRSAPSRIVTVSSDAHNAAKIDLADIEGGPRHSAFGSYGRSKLANILFTYELARRLDGSGVTANALHPGFVATEFAKNNGGLTRVLMPVAQVLGRAISEEEGARTSVYLASSSEVAGVSGKYFIKCREAKSNRQSYELETQRRLWELSASMTGLAATI
jgi:retinol dehydrogenase 12